VKSVTVNYDLIPFCGCGWINDGEQLLWHITLF